MIRLLTLFLISNIGFSSTSIEEVLNSEEFLFVTSYVAPPQFVDPLQATTSSDFLFSQIVYGQFVQDTGGKMGSYLLKREFFPSESAIVFSIKSNSTFSDGTLIRPKDLANAIKRFLKNSPEYPVLSEIFGIKKWIKEGADPDKAIEGLVEDNSDLRIRLNRKFTETQVENAFHSEKLSIIPSRCLDKKFNLICDKIPYSGSHEPIGLNEFGNRTIRFKTKNSNKMDFTILYLSNEEILKYSKKLKNRKKTLIGINDFGVGADDFNLLWHSFYTISTFKTNSAYLILNEKSAALSDIKTRLFLSEAFRHSLVKNKIDVTRSFFPSVMRGADSTDSPALGVPLIGERDPRMANMRKMFRSDPIKILVNSEISDRAFLSGVTNVLDKLGFNYKEIFLSDRSMLPKMWDNGKVSLIFGSHNFRTKDPQLEVGRFLSNSNVMLSKYHHNDEIYSIVKNIDGDSFFQGRNLNRLLLEESKIVLLSHFSRYFFTTQAPLKKFFLGSLAPSVTGLIGAPLFVEDQK